MDKWEGRVVLVTGASSGIGAAIATRLVEHGLKVVGCARNIQKIEELAGSLKDSKGSLTAIQCDVSKEDQILAMFEQIKKQHGGVDMCVNNAGLVHNAPLLTGSTEMWRQMYDINVIGVMICTREAIKSMEERGIDDGAVVLINSLLGHRVRNNPLIHAYSSTKFAVRAIAEGLRNELCAKGSHIRVMSISPGVVETNIFGRLATDKPEIIQKMYKDITPMQPDDVADSLIFSLSAPVRTQVHDILVLPTERPL